jgi:hypothetical protein
MFKQHSTLIWFGQVDVRSVPAIFWRAICDIEKTIDKINFLTDEKEIMLLVEN